MAATYYRVPDENEATDEAGSFIVLHGKTNVILLTECQIIGRGDDQVVSGLQIGFIECSLQVCQIGNSIDEYSMAIFLPFAPAYAFPSRRLQFVKSGIRFTSTEIFASDSQRVRV